MRAEQACRGDAPPPKRQRCDEARGTASAEDVGRGRCVAFVGGNVATSLLLPRAPLVEASGFLRGCPGLEEDISDDTVVTVDLDTEVALESTRITAVARELLPHALQWLAKDSEVRTPKSLVETWTRTSSVVAYHLLCLARFLLCDAIREAVMEWLLQSLGSVIEDFVSAFLHDGLGSCYTLGCFFSEADHRLRRRVACALAAFGPEAAPHAADIATLLEDAKAVVRAAGLEALASSGGDAVLPHAGRIVALLHDADPDVRAAALAALGTLRDAALPHVSGVASLLQDAAQHVRRAAASCVGAMGTAAADAALAQLQLKGASWKTGMAVARALGAMGPPALPHIIPMLKSRTANTRRAGAVAVWELGESAAPAVAGVIALLYDESRHVRKEAVQALWSMGSAAAEGAEDLAALLEDPDATMRRAAVGALGELRAAAAAHAEGVAWLLEDVDANVRSEAATALGRILRHSPPASQELLSRLASSLADEEATVVESAVDALAGVGGEVVAPHAMRLAALLGHTHPDVRSASAEAVAELLAPDQGMAVREATLAALVEMGPAAAPLAEPVAGLLQDEDPHLREEAARALGAVGPKAGEHARALAALLREPLRTLRLAALRALPCLGAAAAPFAAEVAALESEGCRSVRAVARDALQAIQEARDEQS